MMTIEQKIDEFFKGSRRPGAALLAKEIAAKNPSMSPKKIVALAKQQYTSKGAKG